MSGLGFRVRVWVRVRVSAGVRVEVIACAVGFAETIVDVIGKHTPEVVTIDLSNNGIDTLLVFSGLAKAVPYLQNLSLTNNGILVCFRMYALVPVYLRAGCLPSYSRFFNRFISRENGTKRKKEKYSRAKRKHIEAEALQNPPYFFIELVIIVGR
jgi:hypothetical protein